MIIEPISWRILIRDLPITFGLILVMVGLFVTYFLGFINPMLSVPEHINLNTWSAHFFHASPMHLISNLLIALLTGVMMERDIGSFKYALLTVLVLNFLVVMLFYTNPNLLLGFSGIGMGLMSFALLYGWHNSHNRQLLMVLIGLNILFGLFPGVSWHGHFFGAIAGIMAYGAFYGSGLIKH